ncbi:MAG: tRNA uridine-5-carboxymethylaminomethyl(34) synthesis GTPase MnmE [Candidatus Sericytochromatia bacterium]
MHHDTIAAVATPPGTGAIGIVRMSGPEALEIARQLFVGGPSVWQSHRAYYGQLRDPAREQILDHCLLLSMQGPRSYTGEDSVEFHCHGGHFLLQTVLRLCLEQGARLAGPGEFSQRAFVNGKLDLTQAEAVIDLIEGKSRPGLQLAAWQLDGQLSGPLRAVRTELIGVLAAIEASIDFPDEVDVPDPILVTSAVQAARDEIARLLAGSEAGRIWKQGLRLAIVGPPNAGKSTLLNALLRYERAIVSEIAGTTRDTVEDDYNLRGIPVRVIDTAGLRDTQDQIEAIGIARSRQAWSEADLVIVLADPGQPEASTDVLADLPDRPTLIVWNKSDLYPDAPVSPGEPYLPQYRISARTGEGLEVLEQALFEQASGGRLPEPGLSVNERHRLCLLRADEALQRVQETESAGLPGDFLAIDLREAVAAFGEIIGESISETVIHEIFHRFCVGK